MFFKPFPIKVLILRKYGNALVPTFDLGRYEKERKITEEGALQVEYFKLKRLNKKIPAPEIKFYHSDEKGNRWLWLLQVDRDTFYPILFNEKGLFIESTQVVKDGDVEKKEKVLIPLFYSDIILDNGKVVNLTTLIAEKSYDKEYWLSDQLRLANILYRKGTFFEKYGMFLLSLLFLVGLIAVSYIAYTSISEMIVSLSESIKGNTNALNDLSSNIFKVLNVTLLKGI
ncbi:MAG: hypothetical protein RMJ67_06600 [Elusimicrobiota bacterium]|nr:hypothetical protein [Endomicrobiia bacterium]MDW8166163.1 hypothetical protein [Elusimicrobiota bacterium]